MAEKIRVTLGKEQFDITAGDRLTLLCHKGLENPKVVGAIEVTPEKTVATANHFFGHDDKRWRAFVSSNAMLLGLVFGEEMPCIETTAYSDQPISVRHIAGMMIHLSVISAHGRRAYLRMPETYLHPLQQLGLADLLVALSQTRYNKERVNEDA